MQTPKDRRRLPKLAGSSIIGTWPPPRASGAKASLDFVKRLSRSQPKVNRNFGPEAEIETPISGILEALSTGFTRTIPTREVERLKAYKS
jgi:hypothetical protein